MNFVNLNGQPVDLATQMTEAFRQRALLRQSMPASRKPTVKNGYAAPPGTGPEGMTCKQCEHKRSLGSGAKHFIKCELRRATWTSGEGTDILARTPACNKFKAKQP